MSADDNMDAATGLSSPPKVVLYLFGVVFLGTALFAYRLLAVFFTATVLAFALVSLFDRLHIRVLEASNGRRILSAGVTTTVVTLAVIIPLTLFLTSLTNQAVGLYERSIDTKVIELVASYINTESAVAKRVLQAAKSIGVDLTPDGLKALYADAGKSAGLFLYQQVSGLAQNAFALFLHFGVMVILIFTFFLDGTRLKLFLMDLSPLPDDEEQRLVDRFREMTEAIFFGNGTASLLQGICGGLAFSFFGLGPGVLWGTVIAVMAFLPIAGATAVFVPATVYLLLTGASSKALGYFLVNVIYVAALEYGLKPRLIGNRAHQPPVLIFLSIVAGISLFGILGIFYGPLIITMFLTMVDIYKEHYRPVLLPTVGPAGAAQSEGPADA